LDLICRKLGKNNAKSKQPMTKDAHTTLREATATDLAAILLIYNEAIANTTAIYEYDPFDNNYIEQWWRQKQDNQHPVITAEVNGTLAGFATYGVFRARAAYRTTMEHSVYVSPEFQNQGIGRLLLRAIEKEANVRGVHVLVGGIDADNHVSIALHEQEGFRKAAHLHQVAFKFDRWLDLVLVEKILA
jgi:phosphinothricin acetyltransferase